MIKFFLFFYCLKNIYKTQEIVVVLNDSYLLTMTYYNVMPGYFKNYESPHIGMHDRYV